MFQKAQSRNALISCMAALSLANAAVAATDDAPITREEFIQMQKQNQQLQEQLQKQQRTIDSLTQKFSEIQEAKTNQPVVAAAPASSDATAKIAAEEPLPAVPSNSSLHIGDLHINGEGGLAFFDSQAHGQNNKPTFRIDEAKIFLEAPIWNDVYFYTELDLASRESTSLGLNVGELYLDFEDVSKLWKREQMLNVRVGRFYIPFGEEYLNRFAIDNPLISHSVSDIWGADDGVELYGKLGQVQYAVAVQNGGGVTSQALQSDKAVAARLSYDPAKWLHLSASGMRTGNLNVNNGISAVWFGGGWFRPLGGAGTTTFHANLMEADAQLKLPFLNVNAAGGYINYNDNDPAAQNHRDVYYYYFEGVHDWTHELYSAARFSQVFAHNGFPITGNGPMSQYLFDELTRDYWRLSLGLGYRFSPHLLVKAEYSFNQGREEGGTARTHENECALEAAFKF